MYNRKPILIVIWLKCRFTNDVYSLVAMLMRDQFNSFLLQHHSSGLACCDILSVWTRKLFTTIELYECVLMKSKIIQKGCDRRILNLKTLAPCLYNYYNSHLDLVHKWNLLCYLRIVLTFIIIIVMFMYIVKLVMFEYFYMIVSE